LSSYFDTGSFSGTNFSRKVIIGVGYSLLHYKLFRKSIPSCHATHHVFLLVRCHTMPPFPIVSAIIVLNLNVANVLPQNRRRHLRSVQRILPFLPEPIVGITDDGLVVDTLLENRLNVSVSDKRPGRRSKWHHSDVMGDETSLTTECTSCRRRCCSRQDPSQRGDPSCSSYPTCEGQPCGEPDR